MTVQSNKTLGVLGACLTIAGVVGTVASVLRLAVGSSSTGILELGVVGVGALLAFLGFIFFMVAMHGFSQDYSERKIFDHVLNGFVFTFVAIIIAAVLGLFAAVSIAFLFNQSGSSSPLAFTTGVATAVISLIQLVYIIFVNKGLNLLANKSGSGQLHKATKIFLASAVISVVLSVAFMLIGLTGLVVASESTLMLVPGAFIQYVAWYYVAKGFLAIQPPVAPVTQIQPYYVPYAAGQMRYCSNCGAQVQPADVYCVRCGKKL
jgi:Predicted membrane protein